MKNILLHNICDVLDNPEREVFIPLPVKQMLENFYDDSFSDVRIHVDSRLSSRGIVAFASNNKIHISPQAFTPDDAAGQYVIAHEFAHVLQQRYGQLPARFYEQSEIVVDGPLEEEANQLAAVFSIVQSIGLGWCRNLAKLIKPLHEKDCGAQTEIVQCIMIHSKEASRKVDWIGNNYTDDQQGKAKKIIVDNGFTGLDSLTVTGLDGKKYGHESKGEMGENAATSSVSVWWKEAMGSPIKSGNKFIRNNLTDSIKVCGIGTHIREIKGKPAYRMLWRTTTGLDNSFYINNNTVTRIPVIR